MSYQEVSESSKYFGAALRFHLGQQPKTLITIFAETRAEWIISCFGSYTQVLKSLNERCMFRAYKSSVIYISSYTYAHISSLRI